MSDTEYQSTSDTETQSNLTNLSLDLEGLDLIDEAQNLSLFTVTSFGKENDNILNVHDDTGSVKSIDTVIYNKRKKTICPTTMSAEDSANTFLMKFKKALLQWEDVYEEVDLLITSIGEKKVLIADIKETLNDMQDTQLWFEMNPDQRFNDAVKTKCEDVRKKLKDLLKEVRISLNNDLLATPDTSMHSANYSQPNESARIAAATAKAAEKAAKTACSALIKEFNVVKDMKVKTMSELRVMDAAFSMAEKEFQDTLNRLESLKREAAKGEMEVLATEAVENADNLRDAKQEAATNLKQARAKMGLLPGQKDDSKLGVTLPVPVFSGDFSDEMDFYTFKAKLEEYFDVAGACSDAMKLVKLKSECLVAPAKTAVKEKKSYNEAMKALQDLYGEPKILFNAKEGEIRKMGKCPENHLERRTWFIEIKEKMENLLEITRKMKIQTKLYSSNIIEDIETRLRDEDLVELEREVYAYGVENPSFDPDNKELRLVYLIEFVEMMIDKTTFAVRFRMSRGFRSCREVLSNKNNVKSTKSYTTKQADSDDEYESASEETPTQTSQQKSQQKQQQQQQHDDEQTSTQNQSETQNKQTYNNRNNNDTTPRKQNECKPCKDSHTNMAYCAFFRRAKPRDRYRQLVATKTCPRCLKYDVNFQFEKKKEWFKEHEKECNDEFVCDIGVCAEKENWAQQHFTICFRHVRQNRDRQADFIATLEKSKLPADVSFFYNEIHMYSSVPVDEKLKEEIEMWRPSYLEGDIEIVQDSGDPGIYMLQYIPGPNDEKLLLFYDSGCYGAGMSERAYNILESKCVRPGPTKLDVAAGYKVELEHGDEMVYLEMKTDSEKRKVAAVTALRMPVVSSKFPLWSLIDAYNDIKTQFQNQHGKSASLPTVSGEIGNQAVDVMLGISYNKLFPTLVYTLPSGLSIYRSELKGYAGHDGVLGGPHKSWSEAMKKAHSMGPSVFFSSEFRAYRAQSDALHNTFGVTVEPEKMQKDEKLYLPGEEATQVVVTSVMAASTDLKQMKELLKLESLDTDIEYRCAKCRSCVQCKNAEMIEKTSLQEEREQFLIEQSVKYDEERKVMTAELPFVSNPELSLSDNFYMAKKVLDAQMKIVRKAPDMIPAVLASHEKLRSRGFVAKLEDLPPDQQQLAQQSGYYLPWRPVYSGSLSTPCRMVFDASARCATGQSLNCTLAKGQNMLASLFNLLIQFRCGGAAFTADVSMAYNAVQLQPRFYRYQKYLWIEDLAVGGIIIVMVVLTLIYGVKSSGNQTMCAFKMTAELAEKDEKLKESGGPKCLREKMYLDDCLAAFNNSKVRSTASQGLQDTLAISSMAVKTVTDSGKPPDEKVSSDGKHVSVVGYLWETEKDHLKLDVKPLYLEKVKRGRLPRLITENVEEELRQKFTRRVLCSKVAGIFDPIGLVTPVTARFRVDLSAVIKMTDGWDDKIDVKLLPRWIKNLADMQELASVSVPRSILKDGDDDVKIDLIVATDASEQVAAAAVYARINTDRGVECALVTSKSKLVSSLTIPRAELRACTMGASLGEIVKRNFSGKVDKIIYVSDSAVALSWIKQDQRPLQVAVRNQVIQIRRFSDPEQWRHVVSAENPADIATRGAEVSEVGENSEWQRGKRWMYLDYDEMPLKKVENVVLTNDEKVQEKKEVRNSSLHGIMMNDRVTDISDRYSFSKYLLDPCQYSWEKLLRRLAVVQRCVKIWRSKAEKFTRVAGVVAVNLTEDDREAAEKYLYVTTTAEVKNFNKADKLKKFTEKDGVLWCTSRILDDTKPENLAAVMIDLKPLTFTRPVVDRYSPVAYAAMIHAHVKLTHHGGSYATMRAVLEIVHVMQAKSLANEVTQDCNYCKRYKAKRLEAAMGKQHESRMLIAPAFYATQVDLFGPMEAFCKHGRRAVIKVYGIVFKCPTTLAVASAVMDDYSTASFLDGFFRFAARYGLPNKLYIDSGSQLMSACRNAEFSLADITKTLNGGHNIHLEFEVCPVGSHNAHGAVERQIREIKKLMHTVCSGIKLDVLRWETVLTWICNELNSIPLALGNRYTNLDNMDLITPSRLLLGRNNKRAVTDMPKVNSWTATADELEKVQQAWWQVWYDEKLVDLVPQPKKWPEGQPELAAGDVVVFMREQSELTGPSWRVGEINEVEKGRDNVIRCVTVRYKNAGEKVNRYTRRSVRDIAVLWRENELDLAGVLSAAQREATINMYVSQIYKKS